MDKYYYIVVLIESLTVSASDLKAIKKELGKIGFLEYQNKYTLVTQIKKYKKAKKLLKTLKNTKSKGHFCAMLISENQWDNMIHKNNKKRVKDD